MSISPLSHIFSKATNKNLFDVFILSERNLSIHQIVWHLSVCEIFFRSFTNKHFSQNDPYTPNITFVTVLAVFIWFWTHISWRTDIVWDLWFLLSLKFTKPKISDFCTSFCKKNVCSFKITMNNVFLFECNIPLSNISSNIKCIFFLKFFIIFYHLLKISKLTEFSNDVNVIFRHQDINCPKNIFMA